jgi:hypothetical protein
MWVNVGPMAMWGNGKRFSKFKFAHVLNMIANNGEIKFRYKLICKIFIWDGGTWNHACKELDVTITIIIIY